jgi:hypothetical protein
MFELLFKWISRNEKPEFVKNPQEFLSLWVIAHAWEDLDPQATDTSNIPQSIRERLDMLMLAFMREELSIRQINGYRLLGHRWIHIFLGLNKSFNRLANNLFRKHSLEIEFIDQLFVKRSELLRWCEKEYLEPPACWAPSSSFKAPHVEHVEDSNEEEDESWYDKLTQQRRERVACLEVAKFLWEQNPDLKYEQVRLHPAMKQAGLSHVFNAKTFKKWARNVASEEAKRGGRRPQSEG